MCAHYLAEQSGSGLELTYTEYQGFPGASVVKNPPAMQEIQETWIQFLGQKDPLEKGMATHSSILAWRIHGQRSLAGYSPRGRRELDMTEATKHTCIQ